MRVKYDMLLRYYTTMGFQKFSWNGLPSFGRYDTEKKGVVGKNIHTFWPVVLYIFIYTYNIGKNDSGLCYLGRIAMISY